MKIKLYPALSLNEEGRRDNNEDSIYPNKYTENPVEGLFMVCDGVGGNEKGEVASSLACQSFADYLADNKSDKYDTDYFSEALSSVEDAFDVYITDNPQAKGMATTLTLALFNHNGVSLVHIGDSRIYHLRDGAIAYQSKDHSYINALIATGTITEEEAKDHPQRNVILRAITGKSVKPSKIDLYECTSVEPGDYFFLCSDGVLESISDEDLLDIVFGKEIEEEKIENIKHRCSISSDDNYSCILIKVESVDHESEQLLVKDEDTQLIDESESNLKPEAPEINNSEEAEEKTEETPELSPTENDPVENPMAPADNTIDEAKKEEAARNEALKMETEQTAEMSFCPASKQSNVVQKKNNKPILIIIAALIVIITAAICIFFMSFKDKGVKKTPVGTEKCC